MLPEFSLEAGSLLEKVNRVLSAVSAQPSRAIASPLPLPSPHEADQRAMMILRRNQLYVRSQKLLALLTPGRPKKILFSVKSDWAEHIRVGFKRLPHLIEFGPITKDCFERYDIVVPLDLHAIDEARRYSRDRKAALPLPTEEAQRLCNDKFQFNQALIEGGFGRFIPKMVFQGFGLAFPYILKKRIGYWGTGCYMINDHTDEQAHSHLITDPKYFCQEFIQGFAEFATHILFVNGHIVKALNIKYEFAGTTSIKGHDTPLFQVVHCCPYLDLFARMLRTIRFEGLCCVNYKVAGRQPFLLEINPRFGASLSPYFFSFVRHLR